VNYAWGHGAVVIAAAGNDGSASPNYPAYYENSIAVAATRQDDTLAPLSNYGNWVDVAAPGLNIYSTLQDDGYGYKSGTSFATAYVSGLATLLFAIATDTNDNGILSDETRAAMEAGAQKTGNYITGNGRIDAAGALTRIDSSTPGTYQASHS
jgi:thermitase